MKVKKYTIIQFFFLILLLPMAVKASYSGDPNAIINNTVKCPVLNGHPTYAESTEYTDEFEEIWINETEYREMEPTDVFEFGKNYSYHYIYKLKSQFADKYLLFQNHDINTCQYYLGGGSTGANGMMQGEAEFYMGNRDEAEWFERETAILDIDNPTLGGHPPVARRNNKYSIISQKWINTTDNKEMKSTDVFEQNKKYRYEIVFSSFYETGNFFYVFGGSENYLGDSYNENISAKNILKKGYFYFGDKNDLVIDGNAIVENVNVPKAGEKLAIPSVTVDAPVEDVFVSWQLIDEENPYGRYISNPTETTVQVGNTYKMNIAITGENGYKFDDNFTVINNNKNSNFVEENQYVSNNQQYQNYLNYSATYKILEEGHTIGISGDTSIIYPGWGRQFIAYPDNAYNAKVTWTSSDENIVTVDDTGFIWAIAPGTATITATNLNQDSYSINITVGVPAESLILNKTTLTMYVGDEEQLSATVLPDNATDKTVHWSIMWEEGLDYSNLPVEVSYNDGKIIALKPGTIKVNAYVSTGISEYCTVTVIERPVEVKQITLDKSELKVMVNSTEIINATIIPNAAAETPITWLSSDSNIASVNENGEVTGHKIGSAIITAKTPNNVSATCIVNVSDYFGVTFYDQDGSSILKATENYEYQTPASEIVKPTNIDKENLAFVGWYTEPELINKYDFTGIIESNISLYGKWEEINAEITATPSSIDYGEVYANFTEKVQRNIIITNTGNVDVSLSINNPTASGPFASLGFQSGKVLKPGEEYEVKLIADPGRTYSNTPGIYTGTYIITGTYVNNEALKSTTNITSTITILKRPIEILYKTHVQSYGWQDFVKNGEMSGTSGEAKRLEAIKIKLENKDYDGEIEYRTHIQSYGWEKEFKNNNQMSGTSGEGKRLEAIEIRLTGELADHYDVYYRVHAQSFGWLGWARNGEQSGTAGYAKRLEAIKIQLVEKNQNVEGYGTLDAFKDKAAPESITLNKNNLSLEVGDEATLSATILPTDASNKTIIWTSNNETNVTVNENGKISAIHEGIATITATTVNGKTASCDVNVLSPIPGITYQTHVQSYGWQDFVKNGEMSGTSGEAKRLEGIKIKLKNQPYDGEIEYRTHVQSYGWQDFVKNGEMSGTSGEAKRLEAIEIKLTGEMKEHYDIYYRVHAQSFGWLAWAKNGEKAGTAGYAKRLEGIEIVLVEKGEQPPARINQNDERAYIEN